MLSRATPDGQEQIYDRNQALDWGRVDIPPLEVEIAGLHWLFDAETTPEEFLPWLAGWVALALRTDLAPARQRALVANTARLYRIRGTRRGLEEVLKLYLEALPSVTDEDRASLQIAEHSTVGVDTYLGGGVSFLFQVKLAFSTKDSDFVERQRRLAREVLELERPAHTWCEVEIVFPKLQVGVQSTVGVDTVLVP
jgi:phage tail-like protein